MPIIQKKEAQARNFITPVDTIVTGINKVTSMFPGAENLRGKFLINGYLASNPSQKGWVRSRTIKNIQATPGTSYAILKYLSGEGKKDVPKIVEKFLGDKWYTGPAKLLARTPFGRDYVISKILERTLPKIQGSTDLARQYLAAGGRV